MGRHPRRHTRPGLVLARNTNDSALIRQVKDDMERIAIGTFTCPAGTFRQRTEITKIQRDILAQLKIDTPPQIYQLTPASP